MAHPDPGSWRVVTVSYPECVRSEFGTFGSRDEAERWGGQQNFTRTASWYVEEIDARDTLASPDCGEADKGAVTRDA